MSEGITNKPEDIERTEGQSKAEKVLNSLVRKGHSRKSETISLEKWLELCETSSEAYENYDERIVRAIGAPEIVDTSKGDEQERRVFGGEKIGRYNAFSDFYDLDRVIADTANFFRDGGEGILVYRGPVGSGKTDLATRLEQLVEKEPIYILKCRKTGALSPFNDSPKCLFSSEGVREQISEAYNIPERYLTDAPSAWVTKRLEAADGDFTAAFEVEKVFPSRDKSLGIVKLDPKDPKSADLGSLVGEVDLTQVGEEDPLDADKIMSAGDPDAYTPGAFSKSHQGIFHGAEFFRNNPALLNSFLEGVTTDYFVGEKGIGTLPMKQARVFTTNDPVWRKFKSENDSDAARNRIIVIDVPYTLRMSAEIQIYKKLLKKAGFENEAVAPKTLDMLAEFAVVTRLKDGKEGSLAKFDRHIRAAVHNGEIPDGAESKIPTLRELRKNADPEEGLDGFSLRDAARVLKDTFNARAIEGIREADPILLIETLRKFVEKADAETIPDKDAYETYLNTLSERYKKHATEMINSAIIDADDGACQAMFDRYVLLAEKWLEKEDYIDPDSGERTDFDRIEAFLSSMERKANVSVTAQEFRRDAVAGIDREIKHIAKRNEGKNSEEQEPLKVRWDAYEPLAKVIRAQHEMDQEARRHILKAKAESDLKSDEERRQYGRFHQNLQDQGLTDTMIARHLHHLNFA